MRPHFVGDANLDMILVDVEFDGSSAPGDQLKAMRALAPRTLIALLAGDDQLEAKAMLQSGIVIEVIPKRRVGSFAGSAPYLIFFQRWPTKRRAVLSAPCPT